MYENVDECFLSIVESSGCESSQFRQKNVLLVKGKHETVLEWSIRACKAQSVDSSRVILPPALAARARIHCGAGSACATVVVCQPPYECKTVGGLNANNLRLYAALTLKSKGLSYASQLPILFKFRLQQYLNNPSATMDHLNVPKRLPFSKAALPTKVVIS